MQFDTLKNAKANEARLKLLGPTYGVVNIVGNDIIEEDKIAVIAEGFLHIRVGITPTPEDSPSVPAMGDYVNSGLTTETIKRAPNGLEAAKRLALMMPGVHNDTEALARVYAIQDVKNAVETVLAANFR